MSGWKTWFVAFVSCLYGVVGMMAGLHEPSEGMRFIIEGLALVGIGHKIEKAGRNG